MATFWVVGDRELLWQVTNASPGFGLDSADGLVPVEAVGTALVYLQHGGSWECYEVPNVMLLSRCSDVLYSTRVMRDLYGFKHSFDGNCSASAPGSADIPIHDDGSAFVMPVAFVRRSADRPVSVRRPGNAVATLAMDASSVSAFPAGVSGTPQAVLYHRLGFPYDDQWRRVPTATTGHGLPPNASVSTQLPVSNAVIQGRSRALPFHRRAPDADQPPPGAVFYMDFAGPLSASMPH
jgi:hypothetical protein